MLPLLVEPAADRPDGRREAHGPSASGRITARGFDPPPREGEFSRMLRRPAASCQYPAVRTQAEDR